MVKRLSIKEILKSFLLLANFEKLTKLDKLLWNIQCLILAVVLSLLTVSFSTSRNSWLFADFDFQMIFRFFIIGSILTTELKFINKARTEKEEFLFKI